MIYLKNFQVQVLVFTIRQHINFLIQKYFVISDNLPMRYERKYEFNIGYEKVIKAFLLSKRFKKGFPDRIVNSLYYDTFDKRLFFESINGLSNKFKIRVRFYNDINQLDTFEIKRKFSDLNNKDYPKFSESLLPLEFFNNDYFSKDLKLPSSFNKIYYPSVFVSYKRSYYLSYNKKMRITLDYFLDFYRARKDQKRIFIGPKRSFEKNVLEIKYEKNDQPNLNFVSTLSNELNLILSRSSKYCNAILMT